MTEDGEVVSSAWEPATWTRKKRSAASIETGQGLE
jgi:hypothetical protein